MENIDKLLKRINDGTEEKCRAIMNGAEEKCAEYAAKADERIESILDEAKVLSQKKSDAIMARANSTASVSRREIILKAKTDMIDRAFRQAEKVLLSLPEQQYRELLSALLANAVAERLTDIDRLKAMYGDTEAAEKSDFTVLFNESDAREHGKAVIKRAKQLLTDKSPDWAKVKLAEAKEFADIGGGLVLRYGDIETNCSFSALIASSRDGNQAAVAETLFGKEN